LEQSATWVPFFKTSTIIVHGVTNEPLTLRERWHARDLICTGGNARRGMMHVPADGWSFEYLNLRDRYGRISVVRDEKMIIQ
jgi:hypothetical protein